MSVSQEKCRGCAQKVPLITLTGNLSLGALKVVAGMLGNSVGLTVDGFHSLTDGIGTLFVLASLKIAGKPRDESHPYGHGKVEFIASLFVFAVLIGIGIVFLVRSTQELLAGSKEAPHYLGVLVAAVSVVANYVMLNFNLCAGKRINSPALIANGYENLTDLVSSFPVGIGIVAAQFGYFFCDPLAGVLVSLFIIVNASREAWHSIDSLIDASAPPATQRRIRGLATQVAGVQRVGAVRTRLVGQNLWVDLDVEVDPDASVDHAHGVADAVRGLLLRKGKHVEEVVVYCRAAGGS